MVDKKISELNPLTGAASAAGDLFPVVDTSLSETKYITREELEKAFSGIYLGGTTAPFKLELYTETSYTATMAPETSGSLNLNAGVDQLAITRVGRKVTIQGMVNLSSPGSPIGTYVTLSLPYAIADLAEFSGRIGGALTYYDAGTTTYSLLPLYGVEGDSTIQIVIDASTLASSDAFFFDFTYIA